MTCGEVIYKGLDRCVVSFSGTVDPPKETTSLQRTFFKVNLKRTTSLKWPAPKCNLFGCSTVDGKCGVCVSMSAEYRHADKIISPIKPKLICVRIVE